MIKKIRIFDIETKGMLKKTHHIHCLSYYDVDSKEMESTTDYNRMRELFKEKDVVWLGHNIIVYDFPYLKQVLGIEMPEFVIDTLALSWALYPKRKKHGLEEYGEEFGVKKPKIVDWNSLSPEDYIHRCEEDVKINTQLWRKLRTFLHAIYQDEDKELEFLQFLHFRMDCIREQHEEGLRINVEEVKKNLALFTKERNEKLVELEAAMPRVAVKKKKKLLNVAVSPQGTITKQGDLFFEDAIANGAVFHKEYTLETVSGWKAPNLGSTKQVKDWLYSLGWEPQNIQFKRHKKTGVVKQIPQIASKEGQKEGTGEICPSVKKLYIKEPKLRLIEGVSQLKHRIDILEGFLKNADENDILYPSMNGFTNTLRLKHKVIVNLPSVDKKYGKEIRSAIIAKEGHILIGSDLANIEDRTKRHYIYPYDPKYVEDMNVPGYDAHLDIAVRAGFMSQEDADWYVEMVAKREAGYKLTEDEKTRFGKLKVIRTKSKVGNFSLTYKIGLDALTRDTGLTRRGAKLLKDSYWERNKAILLIEENCTVKEVDGTFWLLNPISGFWYNLRTDKDRFSTLNQGTAAFLFDMWIQFLRKEGVKVPFQYHDEVLLNVKEDEIDSTKEKIRTAMDKLNKKYQLNIEVGCSIEEGLDYSNTH